MRNRLSFVARIMVHVVVFGVPWRPCAFHLLYGDGVGLFVVHLLFVEIDSGGDGGFNLVVLAGAERCFAFFLSAVLNLHHGGSRTLKQQIDAKQCKEHHGYGYASNADTPGVRLLDAFGLLGNMIMEGCCGADVFNTVGNAHRVNVIAYSVSPHYKNLRFNRVDAKCISLTIESDHGYHGQTVLLALTRRNHLQYGKVRCVGGGGSQYDDFIFRNGNGAWTYNALYIVAAFICISGEPTNAAE